MKIGRRGFLSLGLGATAGLTLSPVPWKLLDDISIWTQNWPWVPVPEEGKISETQSVCSLCPGGCGIIIRKVDERVVSIRGREDFPVNKGGICSLGLSGPQLLYTPARIMAPMVKVDGAFNRITWDQALELLTLNLSVTLDGKNAEAVACLSDTPRGTVPQLLRSLLTALGSSKFFHDSSSEDTWEVVTKKMFGSALLPGYDLENADYVLSFGCGLVEGWGSPVHTIRIHSHWKENQTTLVQIEPRLSNTAAGADQWVAIRPGTEADLALGIAQVIIENKLCPRSAIQENGAEWSSFVQHLHSDYTADKVATTTGVQPKTIESLAKNFARAKNALALCGQGQGRSSGDSREYAAVMLLNILCGNIDQPGGVDLRAETSEKSNFFSSDLLFKRLAEDKKSDIEILFVNNTNPCYSQPDADTVTKTIEKIPFVVNFSTYWDETAVYSDLLLPNHSYLERYQDVPVFCGLKEPIIGLSKPIAEQIFDTRHTGDVIIKTAQAMGENVQKAFPWNNYYEFLKSLFNDSWEALEKNGYQVASLPETGKITPARNWDQLLSKNMTVHSQAHLENYPFVLIPKDSMRLTSGVVGSPPFMMKTVPDTVLKKRTTVVDIHPSSAISYGLSDGQKARLTTLYGNTIVHIHLDEGTMPGIVVFPRGLGHLQYDEHLAGKGSNYNRLIKPEFDPTSGLISTSTINCSLRNV